MFPFLDLIDIFPKHVLISVCVQWEMFKMQIYTFFFTHLVSGTTSLQKSDFIVKMLPHLAAFTYNVLPIWVLFLFF